MDIFIYSGQINVAGYHAVCDQLKKRKHDEALLVLGTPGGDPHAGFRIARALQHAYGNFSLLVPRYCKSAGTLIAIGAKTIYMADMSELGPLDVQVKKSDELVGFNSGLDIIQAVNNLQQSAMNAFRSYLNELHREARISTKIAADISTKLTAGLFEPIFAQIDPMRLAETQRAMEIAFAYGARLNETSGNLRTNGLADIVTKYPSHGFVIDRKEARNIFINVETPDGVLSQISEALHAQMEASIDSASPSVALIPFPASSGATNENAPIPPSAKGGDPTSESTVSGSGSTDHVPAVDDAANEPESSEPSSSEQVADGCTTELDGGGRLILDNLS